MVVTDFFIVVGCIRQLCNKLKLSTTKLLNLPLPIIFCLSLFRPQQEAQKIFKANHGIDTEVVKAKVRDKQIKPLLL